jgi:hypothetical protein
VIYPWMGLSLLGLLHIAVFTGLCFLALVSHGKGRLETLRRKEHPLTLSADLFVVYHSHADGSWSRAGVGAATGAGTRVQGRDRSVRRGRRRMIH